MSEIIGPAGMREALENIAKAYVDAPGWASPEPTTELVFQMYKFARDALAAQPSPAATVEMEPKDNRLVMRAFDALHGADSRCSAGNGGAVENSDEYFKMLWDWFEERGAIDRYDWSDGKSADDFKIMLDEHEAALMPTEPQAAPKLSDFAELKLLIDEYDPENSDWNFRRGVLLDILVRVWPTSSQVTRPQLGGK